MLSEKLPKFMLVVQNFGQSKNSVFNIKKNNINHHQKPYLLWETFNLFFLLSQFDFSVATFG